MKSSCDELIFVSWEQKTTSLAKLHMPTLYISAGWPMPAARMWYKKFFRQSNRVMHFLGSYKRRQSNLYQTAIYLQQ